jgi:hypothetical protein
MYRATSLQINALKYVWNTGGGATKDNFDEDHDPIGNYLWEDLAGAGFVEVRNDKIYLTDSGLEEKQKYE